MKRRLVFDEAVAAQLRAALERVEAVRLAYAFGSRARGTARPDSDLDLAVLLRPDLRKAERHQALRELLGTCGRIFPADKLDLVLLNEASPLLRHRVLRDGRLLLQRDPVEQIRFRVRSLREHHDLEYYRRRFYEARKRHLQEGGSARGGSGELVAQARRVDRLLRET